MSAVNHMLLRDVSTEGLSSGLRSGLQVKRVTGQDMFLEEYERLAKSHIRDVDWETVQGLYTPITKEN